MSSAGALAALTLAAVLALAGRAKWRRHEALVSALAELRLPRSWGRPVRLLPAAELALAAALVLPWWRPVAVAVAVAAALLMVAYTVVAARALGFDPRPHCGCFGDLGEPQVGGRMLVRNLVLLGLAGVHLWWVATGHSLLTLGDPDALAWLVMAAISVLVAVLVVGRPADERPAASPRAHVPGTPVAPTCPPVVLLDHLSNPLTLREIARVGAVALVNADCTCAGTSRTLDAIPAWRELTPQVNWRVMTSLPLRLLDERYDLPLEDLLTDHGGMAAAALELPPGVPSVALVGRDGCLLAPPVSGHDHIAALVQRLAAGEGLTPAT